MSNKAIRPVSSNQEIDQFIDQAKHMPAVTNKAARIIFAMDATYSRKTTWDHAMQVQGDMFTSCQQSGQLQVQLCVFQGLGQFISSPWYTEAERLLIQMQQIDCLAGETQIARLIEHALWETQSQPVQAVIFIGDAMEENADHLCKLAGQLGLLSTPLFLFQEGNDLVAKRTFTKMAQLSGGAYSRFNHSSAEILRNLLCAVAVYSTGGAKALEKYSQQMPETIKQLCHQLK